MYKQIKLKAIGYIETLIGLVLISGVLLFLLGTATYYIKVATNLEAKDYMQNVSTVYGRLIQGILLNTENIRYQQDIWERLSNTNTPFKFVKDNDSGNIVLQTTTALINQNGQIQTSDSDLTLGNQLQVFESSGIINHNFLDILTSQSNKEWTNKLGIIFEKVDTTLNTNNIIKLKITIACLENACRFKPVITYYYIHNPLPTTDALSDYGTYNTPTPSPSNTVTPTLTPTPTITPTKIIGGGGGHGIGDPTPTTATQ